MSTAYLEVDETGVQTEISKEEFENSDNGTSRQKSKSDTTLVHDAPDKIKGNMKQQLIVIYTPHYNGTGTTPDRYMFIGACGWLKEPSNFQRRTDCIAFKSPDFRWEGLGNDSYGLMVSYHMFFVENGRTVIDEDCYETFGEDDASISAMNGVFFQYNLRNDLFSPISFTDYTNFGFLMFGVGRVNQFSTTDVFKNVSIDFLYRHSTYALSPSISFSWDGKSVSASIGVTPASTKYEDYTLYYPWKFKEDYDKFFK